MVIPNGTPNTMDLQESKSWPLNDGQVRKPPMTKTFCEIPDDMDDSGDGDNSVGPREDWGHVQIKLLREERGGRIYL